MIAALIAGKLLQNLEPRPTADGRTITVATLKARAGKSTSEVWQVQAHDREVQVAPMRLKAGDFVAVQGVPNTRVATVGKPDIQHVLFAEHVTTLKPEGGGDGSL